MNTHYRSNISIVVIALVVFINVTISNADPPGWAITQLTENSYYNSSPYVVESKIIWRSSCGINQTYEMILYDINTGITTRLTNNDYGDCYEFGQPISGSKVVWRGDQPNDSEIFLYNGTTTVQLTDNNYDDGHAQISGSNVVWRGFDGNDREIFLYDGTQTVQITDNTYYDTSPVISDSNVVWSGSTGPDGDDSEIFLYNIDTEVTTRITDNDYRDTCPRISGSHIVWFDSDGHKLFLYNINTETTTQIAENVCNAAFHVSDTTVVWAGPDEPHTDNEIFIYDIETGTTTQLTDNSYGDESPRVYDSTVVWYGFPTSGSNAEIFVYDGKTTTQLTNNSYDVYCLTMGLKPSPSGDTLRIINE